MIGLAEKDMAEMTLEAYNDVFADIFNALVFDGKQVIKEDELEDAQPCSFYKADGRLHEQERDTSKYWRNCGIRISLLGLENQTRSDPDMPLRVISYDGAAYRAQLLDDTQKERCPVVTLVLYFGKRHWGAPLTLHERLGVPEELQGLVGDYKVNLYEIAYLTDEQIARFRSDFRLVAEYFAKTRTDAEYQPSNLTIRHVHEFLQLMSVMTGDHRYEEYEVGFTEKGGLVKMCEVLDRAEARGEARGKLLGELKILTGLVRDGILTAAQAAARVGMSEEEFTQKMKTVTV